MAKTIHKLKDLTVRRNLAPGAYSDGGGLYLQVRESGSKDWHYRYEVNGKGRKKGLGSYPTISLQSARDKADECRKLRDRGIDPIDYEKDRTQQKKLAAGRAKTFRYCAEKYIESHEAEWSNEKHRYQWTQSLTNYAYPVIGDVSVQKIDVRLVLDVLEPIWQTKTETATRVRQRIETIIDWATAHKYRTGENPAVWKGHLDKILPKPTKIRKVEHHPALTYVELPDYFRELRKRNNVAAKALAFIILTATRSGEARNANWNEIKDDVWTIPADRMKSRRPFRIPLSAEANKILQEAEIFKRKGLVFPGTKNAISDAAVRKVLKETYPDLTIHGFRSTFRDWCAEMTSYPREVAEAALSHSLKDKTEAAYQRGDLFEKRTKLMDSWAEYCLKGGKRAMVLPIRKQTK